MNKKRVIIIVVVFLLLGTMIYSFASGRSEQLEQPSDNTPVEDGGQTNPDDEQDDDQTTDEEQGSDDQTVSGDNVVPNTDYLSLALEAVKKAETSLTQNDVDAAIEAIENVADEDTDDLVDRITTVQNIIDFETLLTQLENKTNNTNNKIELDVVRNDEETKTTTTTLDNLAENLTNVETNADKITNLTNRYNTVLAKLNDTTAPNVSGINNGEYTKGPVNLIITDDASFTATLNGENYVTGTEITEDGEYTLIVIDASFNETIITFTVENVKPEVINITQVYEDKEDGRIKVTITTSEEIFGDLIGKYQWRKVDGKNEYYNYYYGTQEVTINFQDRAGNEGTYTFTVDMTAPIFTKLGIAKNGNTGSKYVTNGDSIRVLVYFKEQLAVLPKVKINGVEYNTYYAIQSSNPDVNDYAYHLDLPITAELNLPQGIINFEVYGYADEYGNEGEILTNDDITYLQYDYVVYDTNPTTMDYSTVDFDGTGITPKVEGTRKTYYVKNGTSFIFRIQFSEQLLENPILNVGNKTVELELIEKFVTNEGKYIYQGTVEINEEDNFADGSLPLILSNVKDLSGNVTKDEAVLNQTITSNDRTVVIDNTPSTTKSLYILARDDANYRLSISDGEYLRVEANFNEELKELPVLKVGSQTMEFNRCNFNSINGLYVCVADMKIDNEIAKLVEGEIIPFEVTNVIDLAGNETSFDNTYVTKYYQNGKLVYDQVRYENPFVSMSFHNSTNYKLNEANNNNALSITEAKVGDSVRVFVRFNQDIDIENFKPIIVIGGVAKELNLANIYNDGTKDYGTDVKITKEMNLKLNVEIPFVIKNIVLKNGNSLPNLNQNDITSTNLSGVIYIGE